MLQRIGVEADKFATSTGNQRGFEFNRSETQLGSSGHLTPSLQFTQPLQIALRQRARTLQAAAPMRLAR